MVGVLSPPSRLLPSPLSVPRLLSAWLLLAASWLLPALGFAQTSVAPEETPDESTPRQTLERFLDSSRRGNLAAAAEALDVPPARKAEAPELARRLKAVLDRHAALDLELVSGDSRGRTDDKLPTNVDEIARVPSPLYGSEPVRLIKKTTPEGTRWLFSRGTVSRIDAWYDRLELQYLRERLPWSLQQPGPHDVLYWQWIALPILALLAWLIARMLARGTRLLLARLAARTPQVWDDALATSLVGPMTLAWTLAVVYLALPWLALHADARTVVVGALRGAFLLAFFWALGRAIGVLADVAASSPWAVTHPASRTLVPLGARVGKIAVLAMALVALLSGLGYPVASLLAGLGIGGLALALAAQKTVENLFGAFSIGADQPFREGDTVRIEDFVGTVERIGLRSTKFRTPDRTVISIPNGRLAEMRVESLSARDRLRFNTVFGLVYGTTPAQVRGVLRGIEEAVRAHPRTWQETVIVRLRQFGSSSLELEINAWFETQDWNEFQTCRQEVLLAIMEVIEREGSALALPAQAMHVIDTRGPTPEQVRDQSFKSPASKPSGAS